MHSHFFAHSLTHLPTCICTQPDGGDQNNGVIKLDNVNGKTDAAKEKCLRKCLEYQSESSKKVAGCEVIWDQGNRGCYGELVLCAGIVTLTQKPPSMGHTFDCGFVVAAAVTIAFGVVV